MWDFGWPSTPKIPIGQVNFVLHAVHLDDNHWGVVIIHLQTTNTSVRVHVHMYEPLISECYHKSMEKVWEGIPKDDHDSATEGKEGLRGYLDRWLTVSKPNSEIVIENVEWVLSPRQPDGSSCGVLVVAQCYNYVTGNITEQTYDVSKNDVKVMRLRILWTILHMSKEIPISDTDAATTTETLQKLQKELG
ncbi:Deoxynucleoside triphosphate triphosphohydrolase SAMHD1 [Phytophthora nicotianae]|nr:AP-2 complex subunit sigma [Phytophthora nicotianae]KUF94815.1 Deoxynucleoside triphosphate triphosphohydrolase SAMHD1 [Phytophthora nicotianae]